mmetsp:Transcript_124339/g.348225  ORF Transcript_124339/g.348225 Transcript_124339/m.348225 type:complete len:201 (-) Transcript_124339:2-604(-)
MNPAPSSTALRAWRAPAMFAVSTCARDAGFLAISLPRTVIARPRVSTASTSSASLAEKSATSLSRISVAFFSSASAWATAAPSSSILLAETSMELVSSPIFASSFSFCVVAVFTACTPLVAVSSHHSVYSAYAFAAASPSLIVFASSSSMRLSTVPSGLAAAAAAPRQAPRTMARTAAFIASSWVCGEGGCDPEGSSLSA